MSLHGLVFDPATAARSHCSTHAPVCMHGFALPPRRSPAPRHAHSRERARAWFLSPATAAAPHRATHTPVSVHGLLFDPCHHCCPTPPCARSHGRLVPRTLPWASAVLFSTATPAAASHRSVHAPVSMRGL